MTLVGQSAKKFVDVVRFRTRNNKFILEVTWIRDFLKLYAEPDTCPHLSLDHTLDLNNELNRNKTISV